MPDLHPSLLILFFVIKELSFFFCIKDSFSLVSNSTESDSSSEDAASASI